VTPARAERRAAPWSDAAERAASYGDACHARGHWRGALAAYDRERRARLEAAALYAQAAELARVIGDTEGVRRYTEAAAWERECASVL
jgi:hypothetical protein